jgi:GTP cyclohydrolase IA
MSAVNRQDAARAIEMFLAAIGHGDKIREPDLDGTGARVADMFLDELCAGYAIDTRALVRESVIAGSGTSRDEAASAIVIVRDAPVVTTCPHHLLPSIGVATVAFEPKDKLIGLGTIAALVDAHARRLALQEQIGAAVVRDLDEALEPAWVGCRIVLAHGCMIARGERAKGSKVETIALRCPPERALEAHSALGVGVGENKG